MISLPEFILKATERTKHGEFLRRGGTNAIEICFSSVAVDKSPPHPTHKTMKRFYESDIEVEALVINRSRYALPFGLSNLRVRN